MGLIQNMLKRLQEKKEERKHMENVDRWEGQIATRKLSSNERELMDYDEEERQERIKRAVEKIRLLKKRETWSGKKWNPIYAPNMFNNSTHNFAGGKSVFLQKDNGFRHPGVFFKK